MANSPPTTALATPFVLRRGLWQPDGPGLPVGMSYQETRVFGADARVAGFTLPRRWDNSGALRYLKHLRVSVPDGADGWRVAWETIELPQQVPQDVKFPEPLRTRVVRLEGFEIYPPEQRDRSRVLHTRQVDFELFQGHEHLEKFAWLGDMDVAPVGSSGLPCHAPLTRASRASTADVACPGLKLTFSLHRPALMHLGIDSERSGRDAENLLRLSPAFSDAWNFPPANGPLVLDPRGRTTAYTCGGGRAEAGTNTVRYSAVKIADLATLDLTATGSGDDITLDLKLTVLKPGVAYEFEAFRLLWELKTAITSVMGDMLRSADGGPAGVISLERPAILHAPNFGTVEVSLLSGHAFLRHDSHRHASVHWTGIVLGADVLPSGDVHLLPGVHTARLRLRPVHVTPEKAEPTAHPTLRRSWAGVFAFRPEAQGFSNNAASLNCIFCNHLFADMAHATAEPYRGRMRDLTKYTLELALREGLGYGFKRDHFLDSDASVLIAAGVVDAGDTSPDWAAAQWQHLRAAGERQLQFRDETGLVVAHGLTGNAGERIWSTNWWDVVCFGHHDAFCNAYIYRGLRLLARVARRLGHDADARRYAQAADDLRGAFFKTFYVPETGRLAGWKSKNGQLHDYAFLFVAGIAVCYGLVPDAEVRPLLERLEDLRATTGPHDLRFGLPGNLLTVPQDRQPAAPARDPFQQPDGRANFGIYQNAGLSMSQAYLYLRALGLAGLPVAREMEDAFLDSFEARIPVGGLHTGIDWRDWDGRPCGYEGLLTDQYYVLLAIAQNRGLCAGLILE